MVSQPQKVYQSFYTHSEAISSYMVDELMLDDTQTVLEPCAGDGALIKQMLSRHKKITIDAYDIDSQAIATLHQTFFAQPDIAIHFENILKMIDSKQYDRVIANPPYGGWLDYNDRQYFKLKYPHLYIKETYTLFLYRCLQSLKEGGRLVFIIPNTFLFLRFHRALRQYLMENTLINRLFVFPSSFFPGVDFGYAKLCIITLTKCKNALEKNHKIEYADHFLRPSDLNHPAHIMYVSQNQVYQNLDHAFMDDSKQSAIQLVNNSTSRIGDVADCVTGFYTGDDKKFLYTRLIRKGYPIVDEDQIFIGHLSGSQQKDGIQSEISFIPIVKGGAVSYLKSDTWFVDWSKISVHHYKTSKKSRYQNPSYYFREGIGVPMVSSTKITAALLESRLFDQSIVGIFPKDEKWLYYLLALFNSPTINTLIRLINSSANNSANYIRKIPFLEPTPQQLQDINELMADILDGIRQTAHINQIKQSQLHGVIATIYNL
jgi:adenine-specific DNA-methyltransferase